MCLNRPCFPVNTTQLWHTTFSLSLSAEGLVLFPVASSAPPPFSVSIPGLTMPCSRQCDVFKGCSETWLLFMHQRVMGKNTVPCSHLHVLHVFFSAQYYVKSRVNGKTLSMSLQKHFYCCDMLEPATEQNTFDANQEESPRSMNRQPFHAYLCCYTPGRVRSVFVCKPIPCSPSVTWPKAVLFKEEERGADSSAE